EIYQDAHAGTANRVGDRRAHSYRRKEHHDVGELEHRFGEAFGQRQQRTPLILAHHRQRDSEQNAEDDDLQDLSFRDGLGNVFREDMEDDIGAGYFLNIQRFARGRRDSGSDTGLADIDSSQPDE